MFPKALRDAQLKVCRLAGNTAALGGGGVGVEQIGGTVLGNAFAGVAGVGVVVAPLVGGDAIVVCRNPPGGARSAQGSNGYPGGALTGTSSSTSSTFGNGVGLFGKGFSASS